MMMYLRYFWFGLVHSLVFMSLGLGVIVLVGGVSHPNYPEVQFVMAGGLASAGFVGLLYSAWIKRPKDLLHTLGYLVGPGLFLMLYFLIEHIVLPSHPLMLLVLSTMLTLGFVHRKGYQVWPWIRGEYESLVILDGNVR